MRKSVRIATAELQRDRMLRRIEIEMTRHVAELQRTGGHHLSVEMCPRADQAQEKPAMAVGPVHHRGNAQPVRQAIHLWYVFDPQSVQ